MRLFKANQKQLSAEDEAAIVRLMDLANRFKVERSADGAGDENETRAQERPQ
ncbi:MAG: hypothetical protein ACJ8FI_10010 [Sphingomicrobium sp.]